MQTPMLDNLPLPCFAYYLELAYALSHLMDVWCVRSFGLDRLSSLFYYFRPKQGPLIISLNSFFRLKILLF
ncbi:hypothetical protein CGMCC3_g10081 [Colletotrichum fructicola]|nr:uncharacterized protein CGMCC3_g10081 [Colletotrichum fructicola]KAE9573705.1 hypothetical protein CGMCC3_g10081 [Colletotrichum fructicola]